jgi:hypothetical protein
VKKTPFFSFLCLIFTILFFVSCNNVVGNNNNDDFQLKDYQNLGASVAAKEYREGSYDCSNYATQFYQNCYEEGLPCRIRFGISGGSRFSVGNHAWNSVKINGEWVNWEPQLNDLYNGHRQTWTSMGGNWGNIHEEDISRILYETIGKYVPESMINLYEIDTYALTDSPFYSFFVSEAYCFSDDQDANYLVSQLEDIISENDDGAIVLFDQMYLVFMFKYQNKYYGIEVNDPLEGRSTANRKNLKDMIRLGAEIEKVNITRSFEQK